MGRWAPPESVAAALAGESGAREKLIAEMWPRCFTLAASVIGDRRPLRARSGPNRRHRSQTCLDHSKPGEARKTATRYAHGILDPYSLEARHAGLCERDSAVALCGCRDDVGRPCHRCRATASQMPRLHRFTQSAKRRTVFDMGDRTGAALCGGPLFGRRKNVDGYASTIGRTA